MQVIGLWCKTWYRSNSYCGHKSYLNRDVSIVPLLNWKKIESHFETWSSDAQRINLAFVAHSFVANFVRYISAKYYLNWFSFHTVIMKVLGVNFFETQCKACRPRKSIVWVVLLVWFSTLDCKAAFSNKITVDRSVCTADTCFSSWASLIASQRCHQPRPKCCCSAMKCCEALYQLLLQLSAAYMTRGRDEQLCSSDVLYEAKMRRWRETTGLWLQYQSQRPYIPYFASSSLKYTQSESFLIYYCAFIAESIHPLSQPFKVQMVTVNDK